MHLSTQMLIALVLTLFLASPALSTTGEVRGLTQAGIVAMQDGNYTLAEQKLTRASKLARVSGPLYTDYAESLLNLGKLYDYKKQVDKSEKAYNEALEIYKKAYGAKALQVAKCYHGLGELYRHNKQYVKSIPSYNKALAIRRVSAPEHTDLAESAYGLAKSFLTMDQFEEAQPLLKEVVSIQEKAYGPNDKRMVKSLFELATAYEGAHKSNLAIPTYKRVIAILEAAYGKSNPRIASTYERMGSAYARTMHYKNAELAYEKALEIRKVHKKKFPGKYSLCIEAYIKVLQKLKKDTAVKEWQARLKELK